MLIMFLINGNLSIKKFFFETSGKKLVNRVAPYFHIILTGKEVQTTESSGQDEGDSAQRGGKVQTLCLQSGREEPGPDPQVGGEVSRVYRQLPGAFWTGWSLGMFTLTLIHKIYNHIPPMWLSSFSLFALV